MSQAGRAANGQMVLAGAMVLISVACLWFCVSARASGDVNAAACGFESEVSPGFRSYLPDCRAFELVTPAYDGGDLPTGVQRSEFPMSANGEHLLVQVFAGFAETKNLEQDHGVEGSGGVYELSRTPSGWSAESLEPPASVYPRRNFVFASAGLGASLWEVEQGSAPGEELPIDPPNGIEAANNGSLVIREPAGAGKGSFTLVGPVAAPGHIPSNTAASGGYRPPGVGGASADLAEILLNVPVEGGQAWPGDQTHEGVRSLYEYRGTGNAEPALVGVRNQTSLAEAARNQGKPHMNEVAELIGRCGTVFGGARVGGTALNAVSASGEDVYVTVLACEEAPEVNELYVRIAGTRTVAISEPSSQDCSACDTSRTAQEAAPGGAIFEGASQDGSKVFFTTEQALLPGASGQNLYEYNFDAPEATPADPDGRISLLSASATPEFQGVVAIAQDGARVYFADGAVLTGVPNGNQEKARPGASNLYVYDTETGQTAFVADEATVINVSNDGQFALLESTEPYRGTNNTSSVAQLFEYDAKTTLIARVSGGQTVPGGYVCEATHRVEAGFNCDGNTATTPALTVPQANIGTRYAPSQPTTDLSLAADGTVVFTSTDQLTPSAVPSRENVYEYRAGNVYLIAPGDEAIPVEPADEPGESRLRGISESGTDILFASNDALVPQDTSTQTNWYDAREEGGFPPPATPSGCQVGSCQGLLSPAPLLSGVAGTSATALAGDDLAPPSPNRPASPKPRRIMCKKGHAKKKGKCVKRPSKAKKASAGHGGRS